MLNQTLRLLFISWPIFVQLLFESGDYSLHPRQPLPHFNFCRRQARAGALDSTLNTASTREWRLFLPTLLVVRRQFDSAE